MAASQPVPDLSADSEETGLRRGLTWRRTVLQVFGIGLIVAGLVVNWPPPDDPALPATRPFLVLLGILVFAAGLALDHHSAGSKRTRSGTI